MIITPDRSVWERIAPVLAYTFKFCKLAFDAYVLYKTGGL